MIMPQDRMPNFEIRVSGERVLLTDLGPWDQFPTITNAAENVVRWLFDRDVLKSGVPLHYYDSEGEITGLAHDDKGNFTGFYSP